jgi:hypothetical protein
MNLLLVLSYYPQAKSKWVVFITQNKLQKRYYFASENFYNDYNFFYRDTFEIEKICSLKKQYLSGFTFPPK